jgi:hypothetical protein
MAIPAPLRRLIRVSDEFAHIVRLPMTMLLRALRPWLPTLDSTAPAADEAGQGPTAEKDD